MPDAFFIDSQNYRLDAVVRLFGFLGVNDASARLHQHPALRRFLREQRGESTTLDAQLSAFIQRRNEAAHSHVDEIIGLDEFHSLAEFVLTLCDALAELLAQEVTSRRVSLGQVIECGIVEETHYGGFVVVARMRSVPLARGDELVILHNAKLISLATIESLEANNLKCDQLTASDGQEVGIRLSERCIRGNKLARLVASAQRAPTQMSLLANEECPDAELLGSVTEDAVQLPDLEPETDITEEAPPAAS